MANLGRTLWPPLLFLLCSLILFREAILESKVFFENDTLLFYQPIARLFDSVLDRGSLPLWTPYIFAGHPLFADGEAGMLYPPNLIAYLLLPAGPASILLRVLRFFMAGWFAYLYGRALRLGQPAATMLGLAFAYGSFMVGQMHHTNVDNTALWLPLLLTGMERGIQTCGGKRISYFALGAVSLGAAELTLHANPLAMILMLAIIYLPFRVFLCHDVAGTARERLHIVALGVAVSIGIGLALGSVQSLPLWELGNFSRGQGVTYDFATGFGTPPANLITLLFPYFFRDAAEGYWSPWFRWTTTIYIGIVPLLLASVAVALRRDRIVWFYVAITLAGLALAFGDYLPAKFYAVIFHLPVFSMLRAPARFIYWTTFALAVLAAFGTQALIGFDRSRASDRSALRRLLIGATAFSVGLPLALSAARYVTTIYPQAAKAFLQTSYLALRGANLERTLARDPFEALRYSLDVTSTWTMRALLWLGLALLFLWLSYRWPKVRNLCCAALIVLAATDLLTFAGRFHPTMTMDALQSSKPAAEFLAKNSGSDRVLTLWPTFDTWPNRLLPLRVAEASGYSSLTPRRHEQFLGRATQGNANFLDLLGVKYVAAATNPAPNWLASQTPSFQNNGTSIYERRLKLPRAFLVHKFRTGNANQVLAGLADPTFDPRTTVWLEDAVPDGFLSPAPQALDQVEMIDYRSESVSLRTSSSTPAFLVLGDTYYPGWSVYVDGLPAKIYRANYIFRAVPLLAGDHTLRFAYEPVTVRLGAAISIAAFIAILGLFAFVARRQPA